MEIHQMDVVAAFLAGDIDEEIYMEQPEGFEQGKDLVCLLNKSIYGLKQSARLWNQRMRNALLKWGFIQLFSDNCVYYHPRYGVIIALYVDDLLIFGKDTGNIEKVKGLLSGEFEMKDMGELKYCLGIQVQRDRKSRTIHISQSAYINKILYGFRMKESNLAPTPITMGMQL